MRRLVSRAMSTAAAEARPGASLITTPIFYVNGKPHIGHVFSGLLADVMSRSHRMAGRAVRCSTGTDEHGNKVADAAAAAGMEPEAYCKDTSQEFRSCFDRLSISYDAFIRTTDPAHKETVLWLWRRLRDRGYITFGQYEGWYCKSDEAFLTERQLVEDDDGTMRSAESGHVVERVSESGWMFALQALREPLLELMHRPTSFVQPESRRQELLSLLNSPQLADVFVSRPTSRAKWGIPVPEPTPGSDEAHTVYVWLDALANYLTVAGGAPAAERAEATSAPGSQDGYGMLPGGAGAGPSVMELAAGRREGLTWQPETAGGPEPAGAASSGPWSQFAWPPAAHVVGKDIARFHCIVWPAVLLAAGLEPPGRVVVHGHFTSGRRKMSKSLGNVVCPTALVSGEETVFADGTAWRPPPDALRWYLLGRAHLGADGDFDPEDLRSRWDGDVADAVGNLFARLTGHAILPGAALPDPGPALRPQDDEVLEGVMEAAARARSAYDACDGSSAATAVVEAAAQLNAYVTREEPWRLGPKGADEPARLAQVLWTALEGLRILATALQPALPRPAELLLDALAVPAGRRGWDDAVPQPCDGSGWRSPGRPLGLPRAAPGAKKRPAALLFLKSGSAVDPEAMYGDDPWRPYR